MVSKTLSRRLFLRSGIIAAGAMLAACEPKIVTVKETVVVEKVVEKPVEKVVQQTVVVKQEVQKEVTKIVEKVVKPVDKWISGKIAGDIAVNFRVFTWEEEGEARKYILAMQRFWSNYYPKVTMQYEFGVPWGEYWTKLPTIIAAGNPPELAMQHCSRGTVFPAKGWAVDLTDYISVLPPDGWPDDWAKTAVAPMTYKGKVYALPWDWCPQAIYVNRDLMDKYQAYPAPDSWTLDDMARLAAQANNPDPKNRVFGLNIGIGYDNWRRLTKENGGDIFNKEMTKVSFNSDLGMAAAQYLWDVRWKAKIAPTPADFTAMGLGSEMAFASGKVAMHSAINDACFRLDELIGTKFKWGIYPWPTGKAGRYAYQGNSGWFIPKGAKQPALAYEIMRFVTSNPDVLPTIGVMGSTFPSRKSFVKWGCPTGELAQRIPNYYHAFVDMAVETEEPFPWWPGLQEWEATYKKWMDPVFIEGKPDVKSAVEGLQKESQAFFDAGWWMK